MRYARYTKRIAVPFTAHEWSLYTEEPGACLAAQAMTKALIAAVEMISDAEDPEEGFARALRHMDRVTDRLDKVGACDSEPQNIIQRCLERVLADITRSFKSY